MPDHYESIFELPCSNVDAPLLVTVREYRRLTPLYRVQMSTSHYSSPCMSIDFLYFYTVRKCWRATFHYRGWVYRLPTPLYRAQISMLHSSLPPVSIDAPHFPTVRKCRRPTPRYLAWVSTPHNSISRTNIEAKHFVTVRREYWSNLLPHLVSLLLRKWGGKEAVIWSFGPVDESLLIRSSGVYLHVVLDSFEVILKTCRFVHRRPKLLTILEI